MKVLYQSYNTCCQNQSGGVQNRLRTIHNLLNKRGIIVDFFSPFETKVEDYDILHVFSLSPESFDLVRFAKQKGLKIVLSPIVNLNGGMILDLCRLFINKLPFLTAHKMSFFVANNADLILTESNREALFISKHYNIESSKFKTIPNGISCDNYDGIEIYEKIGNVGKYILQVGRFDKNKNQLNIIKALYNSNIDVVFVGGAAPTSESYYKECQMMAADNKKFHFLGWLDSDSKLLKSAYANADIVVLPSYHETFGLVILEGAIRGAKIAVSETLPILEYEPLKHVCTFNPSSVCDIRNKINTLLLKDRDEKLKDEIKSFFLWDNVINKHIECYEKLFNI